MALLQTVTHITAVKSKQPLKILKKVARRL